MDQELGKEVVERLTRVETKIDIFVDTFREHNDRDGKRLAIVEDELQDMRTEKLVLHNQVKQQALDNRATRAKIKWIIGILTSLVGLYITIKSIS